MKKFVSAIAVTASIAILAAGVSAASVSKVSLPDATQVIFDADGVPIPADFKANLDVLTNDKTCVAQQVAFIKDAMKGGPSKISLSACGNLDATMDTGKVTVKADASDIGAKQSTITLYSDPKTRYKVGFFTFWKARTGQTFTFENNNGKKEIRGFVNKPSMTCTAVLGWHCTADTEHSSTTWLNQPLTILAHGNYDFWNDILQETISFAHDGTLTWNGAGTWEDGNPLD